MIGAEEDASSSAEAPESGTIDDSCTKLGACRIKGLMFVDAH